MDTTDTHEHKDPDRRVREMVIEVTTNAQGEIVQITFQRSSGKEAIDSYVADTIRQNFPRTPSTRSVASLTYSVEKGFSQPKILSTVPLQS